MSRQGSPGTHEYAYWIGARAEGVESMAYVVGKRKLKLYVTTTGRSVKTQSILIGETAVRNNLAYADLAELLEGAKDRFTYSTHTDHHGHTHPRLEERTG